MKKSILFSVVFLFSVICLVSCGGPDKYLMSVANVSSIPSDTQKRDLQAGNTITGVLLKYHKEGLVTNTTLKGLSNPNTFYLDMLGQVYQSGGESSFGYNYVLYVPDCVKDEYNSGNGKNPDSGNPFWWYMKTYYNSSLSDIKEDWNGALSKLVDKSNNREIMIYPSSKDVSDTWKTTE